MPLFGKFNTKKTPPRKSSLSETNKDIEQEYNFIDDDNIIKLCLGDNETIFEDGQWISGKFGFKLYYNDDLYSFVNFRNWK